HLLFSHYDPLMAESRRARALQAELKVPPPSLSASARAEIARAIERYGVLANEREAMVERFKSDNAVVKNSLAFLHFAAREAVGEASGRERVLAAEQSDLARDLLVYSSLGDEELAAEIDGHIEALEAAATGPRGSPEVLALLAHARAARARIPALNASVASIVRLRPDRAVDEVRAAYDRGYDAAARSADAYRLALALACAALAGLVGRVMARLRRAAHELNAAKERLEERVRERTAELREATRAAEGASRAKSTFLANMSHELRTPLNAIIGYSELIAEETCDADMPELAADLEKIRGAGKHLLSLINDVLDLSKIEAGRVEVSPETFSLETLVRGVEVTARPLVGVNGNALGLRLGPGLGAMYSDPTMVRQVLYNLLSNAAKFTADGAVTLEARGAGEGWVELSVVDTGMGIPADQLASIFQEFVQGEHSTTCKQGGTGLGLAISKRLCALLGGSIAVESQVGRGSTFRVRLPLHCPAGPRPTGFISRPTLQASRPPAAPRASLAPPVTLS
nr:ATP-binding protein [Polyangiaceae bacterium]